MAGSAWRSDPWGRHEERWFDGTRWTEHVRGRGEQSTDFIGGRPALPPPGITMPTEVFTVTTSETFSMSESGGDPAVLADSIELMWSSMGPEQRRALCVAWQASPGSFRESFESEAGGGEVWAELEAVLAERC